MELPRVEFKVLGRFEAVADGRPLPLGGPKQRTLLAALLVNANTTVSGERLCRAIWGAAPPASAQANIRSYAAALRRVLHPDHGGERVGQGHGGYQLRVLPGEVDLHRFEDLAARGRSALAGGDARGAAEALREALELWRGDAFEGVAHHDALQIEVAHLEESRLTAFEDHAEARLALGEHRELVGPLREQTARHPLRESLWAKLMIAQYRSHQPADALKSYASARAALRDELGLEPGAELRRLQGAVLRHDPSLSAAPVAVPAAPPQPVTGWQPMSQIPADTPDFTGREQLVERALTLLEPSRGPDSAAPPVPWSPCAVPAVLLTGLPGVGKTTLATRLAHELRATFTDGRLFVHLEGSRGARRTPGAVLADLLHGLGVSRWSVPETTANRAALFRSLLSERRVLVVLDDAVDEAQVRPLLPGTPGCAAVITSRARLAGLSGAQLMDVPLFDEDESRALLRWIVGAPRLAAEPEATDRLVATCAGLPLALRATGARLAGRPHWRIARLADRLADEQGRLSELTIGDLAVRTRVAASYHGLTPEAAHAFRAVGLLPVPRFPHWVLGALLDSGDTENVTDDLLDANLVQVDGVDAQGHPRYRMHDLLHVYATERALDEDTPQWREAAVARVLGGWVARVRAAAERLSGDGAVAWLEGERAQLVAVAERAAESGYGEHTARLAAALEDVCRL